MSTVQNLTVTIGQAENFVFEAVSANAEDRVMAIIYFNGSAAIVKQNTKQGGSDDEVTIKEGESYTVKLNASEAEKFAGNESNATHKLFVYPPIYEPPYDALLFTGDITVNPRPGEEPQTVFIHRREVFLAIGELPNPANHNKGDVVTLDDDDTVYIHNGEKWEALVANGSDVISVTEDTDLTFANDYIISSPGDGLVVTLTLPDPSKKRRFFIKQLGLGTTEVEHSESDVVVLNGDGDTVQVVSTGSSWIVFNH